MGIIYPTNRKEVFDRVATDILANLPESEPFLRNSYLQSLAIAYAGALFDAYKVIEQLQLNLFPDTATGEFADRWASYKNIIRNAATQSHGFITVTGIASTTIPIHTLFQSTTGIQYSVQHTTSIVESSIQCALTRTGTTVTATTINEHHFRSGMSIVISGAVPTDYNGTFVITATANNQFSYEISTTPISPAIGFILATATFANCEVLSVTQGADTNLGGGNSVSLTSIISGADSTAYTQYDGLTGGIDIESDEDFRKRYLYAYQHPIAYFNVSEIVTVSEKVAGVTRVFVKEITPDVGQVTIYFMRDNDANPIPSPQNILDVRTEILKIKPAHVDPNDIFIYAPTPKPLNFRFISLDPDTTTMRTAIENSLRAFFQEVPVVGENLSAKAYQSVIYYTVDPSTGQFVHNFNLGEPIGDQIPLSNEIFTLGTITWPLS